MDLKRKYSILIVGASSNPGGIEAFLKNNLEKFNKEKFKLTFLSYTGQNWAYQNELKNKVLKLCLPSRNKHYLTYRKKINDFYKANGSQFDCIWFNLIDLTNIDMIKAAHKYGIKKIIVHAHNSKLLNPTIYHRLQHYFNKKIVPKYATNLWACSETASNFFYPNTMDKRVKIINNAILPESFSFNKNKRIQTRDKYNLNDCFVIGNVGRLEEQKNQKLAIDIIKRLSDQIPNLRLVIVGQGSKFQELKTQVEKYDLENKVLFVGVQKDMQAWYSSFDLFLFPSLYEGLSVASLEAQANGLPILASEEIIPDNSKINANLYTISLKSDIDEWVDKVLGIYKSGYNRIPFSKIADKYIEKGFDIRYESKKLEEIIGSN